MFWIYLKLGVWGEREEEYFREGGGRGGSRGGRGRRRRYHLEIQALLPASGVLRDAPCNARIDEALARAQDLHRQGVPLEMIDTTQMQPDQLQREYINAIAASVVKKYRVRQVFGSRRHSGWLFGRGAPALAVVGPSGTVEDVYPHDRAGKFVTISDFFDSLREEAAPAAVTNKSGRKRR